MGKFSRRKGVTFERFLVRRLRSLWPNVQRGIGQARSGGEVADIENTAGFWIEAKHGARPDVWSAMEQAVEASAGRRVPVVIARKNGRDILVCMRIDDWVATAGLARSAELEA